MMTFLIVTLIIGFSAAMAWLLLEFRHAPIVPHCFDECGKFECDRCPLTCRMLQSSERSSDTEPAKRRERVS